jgi:hypothetical protein
VSGLTIACGLALVSGVMTLRFAEGERVRVAFGIVFVLYGVLRIAQVRTQAKRAKEDR